MKYIYAINEVPKELLYRCGGKGRSLVKLTQMRLSVPKGYIILSDAFSENGLISEAKDELCKLIINLSEKYTYAVRSSAIEEDGDTASFAGAYETMTDVEREKIIEAVNEVADSRRKKRVQQYAQYMNKVEGSIAVVIQRFVKPEFAGVVFTSDSMTGSAAVMQGNYIQGEGEKLVSGNTNAETFTFDALKYAYKGKRELRPYAKKLYDHCTKIRKSYGCPMDIEWAVSGGKLFLLQARPITTLKRYDQSTYWINGSLSGEYLLSKTNVGEIFMCTVSPATYGILESICTMLGVPCFIDNVCGQAYCNISVICSLLVSFGISKKRAYALITDLAGKLPEDIQIPVFPFDKWHFLHQMTKLILSRKKSYDQAISDVEFVEKMADQADEMMKAIQDISDNMALYQFWFTTCEGFMTRVMRAIMSSLKVKPLLSTRKKLTKIAGEELAEALCAGCTGDSVLDSMKPLLMLEDVIAGKMTKEAYIKYCGHRSVNEMELSKPYPYEDPNFPENIMATHIKMGINVHEMKNQHEKQFHEAVHKFELHYPKKIKWLEKTIAAYMEANEKREKIRHRAVKLFCVLRTYLLQAATLNGLGDGIFMLSFNEVLQMLSGDDRVTRHIAKRQINYQRYLKYPAFPNIILGRFEPERWLAEEKQRYDFYEAGKEHDSSYDVKGFPGATGIVTGKVRVLTDLSQAELLQKGEILVTMATNIGWTVIFPRAAAIITDIGAPLSHAAIVAREFGIPAVVGCGNATTLLKTGDLVEVDGSVGSVRVVKKKLENKSTPIYTVIG